MGLLDDIIPGIVSEINALIRDDPITIVRRAAAAYEPVDGEEKQSTPVTYTVRVTPFERFTIRTVDGGIKQRWRAYYSTADLQLTPDPATDTIIDRGVTYKLVEANPVSTGDTIGLWEVVVEL